MVFGFMGDGSPVVYYGQEQYFHGASDPVSAVSFRDVKPSYTAIS